MNDELIHDAKYWSARLNEITKEASPIREKLYTIPTPPLTLEEELRLRYLLSEYAVYTDLLSDAVAKHDALPKNKSFLKKLFKK